jgi:hypothetical protein|nr:MAG TPA: hypothetical protein [Caudoviricetes sp.]
MSLFHAAQFKSNDGKITVFSNGSVGIPKRMRVIPPTDIVDIAVEDGEALRERVTVTRILAVGVFAWALKKKSGGTKFLLIETVDDAHLYELKAKYYKEARSFAAKAMTIIRKGQAAAAEEAAREEARKAEEPEPAPEPTEDAAVDVEPTPKRWWQKTTGDLINERRAKKGKAPINFNAA